MSLKLASWVVLAALGASLHAQTPALQFDVASIRRNVIDSIGAMSPRPEGDGLDGLGLTALQLIAFGYFVDPNRVLGGPAWVREQRFDVRVRTKPLTSALDMRAMMQTLLTERFGLEIRRAQRHIATWMLFRLRPDAPLGPALRRAPAVCDPALKEKDPRLCRGIQYQGDLTIARGVTPRVIAQIVGERIGGPVTDKTGLEGNWDFELTAARAPISAASDGVARDPQLSPSVVVAVEEQLGLQLTREPDPLHALFDHIVIVRIEPPTDN